MRFTGNEALLLNGKELPYSMFTFWQSSYSEILLNLNRGTFAEFLVKCAMQENGLDALHQEKKGNEPYDISGPVITTPDGTRQSRIEVKSAASLQDNSPEEITPLPSTRIVFSIRKAIDWEHTELGEQRNNDVYVFCHYTATRKKDNMLDLGFWDFYVLSTARIEADPSLAKQKTISLYRLKKLGIPRVGFGDLYDAILSELKAYYTLA